MRMFESIIAVLRKALGVSPSSSLDAAVIELEAGNGAGWGTLSSLSADPNDPSRLYAVTDGDSPPLRIIAIEVAGDRAWVAGQTVIETAGLPMLDVEGSAITPSGGFWLASEGKAGNEPPNFLFEVDVSGRLLRTLDLPPEIASGMRDSGFEGVSCVSKPDGNVELYVCFQAGLAGDPDGVTRIAAVDPSTGAWRFFGYPLEAGRDGKFCGLSDILHLGGERFALIERDGKGGKRAIKLITTVDLASVVGSAQGAALPVLEKHIAADLVPVFLDDGRKVEEEIEGLAIAADGLVYVITDNDGERPTVLLKLGQRDELFGPARG